MDPQNKVDEGCKVYQNFQEIFENVLDCHAPRRTKVFRANHNSHFDKNRQDITKFSKQQNLVIKLNRETKLQNFDNLETSKNMKLFGIDVGLIFLTNVPMVVLK